MDAAGWPTLEPKATGAGNPAPKLGAAEGPKLSVDGWNGAGAVDGLLLLAAVLDVVWDEPMLKAGADAICEEPKLKAGREAGCEEPRVKVGIDAAADSDPDVGS